jgi:ribonuclease D
VLSDLAVTTIAHHPPSSIHELQGLRGVDGRHLRANAGREILDAVREGLALPADALRAPPADDIDRQLRPAVTLASAWSAQLASDLRIDPGLLATRADLSAFVRGDAGARLRTGWRHDLVGAPLQRLVDGEAALAFAGRGKLTIEERSGRPYPLDARPLPSAEDEPSGGAPWSGRRGWSTGSNPRPPQ